MTQDELKLAVAQAAIDYVIPKIRPDDILGIGTGSTANHFIDLLGEHKEKFAGTVASSNASADRLKQLGIDVVELNSVAHIKCYIDGADETNPSLQLIKGGGAALTREKIVAASADEFICIADDSKWVETLGEFPLPVEVIPMAINHVRKALEALGGTPVYREGVITDNGGAILDVHGLHIEAPIELEAQINHITGVITNGLFSMRPADLLLLGSKDGVKTITAK